MPSADLSAAIVSAVNAALGTGAPWPPRAGHETTGPGQAGPRAWAAGGAGPQGQGAGQMAMIGQAIGHAVRRAQERR